MIRVLLSILAWVIITVPLFGQNIPLTIYAESFRHGSTRITEEGFDLKLTPEHASYHENIKDSQGKDRYELTIAPLMPGGDDKVTSWKVTLKDLHHTFYRNLLVAEQEPSEEAKNNMFWLNPKPTAPVPVRAKRVMKVEDFYLVVQVKDLHFTPLDSPYLDSMAISFALTNSDPRTSH
ncbi:MAG TPA: hypothetical protein VIX37_16370 [Candidatus Sulfotelmatobacter sp.]